MVEFLLCDYVEIAQVDSMLKFPLNDFEVEFVLLDFESKFASCKSLPKSLTPLLVFII